MNENPSMDDLFLRKITGIILENLGNENFGVRELAQKSGISRSALNRKINKITNRTVNQFIREIRLEKAIGLLQNESLSISEVAYKVGFSSPAYFTKCFHEFTGYPPGKVKKNNPVKGEKIITERQADNPEKVESMRKPYVLLVFGFFVLLGALAIFFVRPERLKRSASDDEIFSDKRISIAVMPFINMTHDTIWDDWQEWIQDMLISYLSNYGDLQMRQKESIRKLIQGAPITNYASLSSHFAGEVSQKLNADFFISGNIRQSGAEVRLTAQIVDSKTLEITKYFEVEGSSDKVNYFPLIDTLRTIVGNYLIITKLKKKKNPYQILSSTSSPEAYRYFLNGDNAFYNRDFALAEECYLRAIDLDSGFIGALTKLSYSFYNQAKYIEAWHWYHKAAVKKDQASLPQKIYLDLLYATLNEPPEEEIRCARRLLEVDDQLPTMYYRAGVGFNYLFQYERAIPEFEKSIEINKKWDLKPDWILTYVQLGLAYHNTGKFRKEKRMYKRALQDFPDEIALISSRQAILSLTRGKIKRAGRFLDKYISESKAKLVSEADIANGLGTIYYEAGFYDETESYYRKALSLEHGKILRLNRLSYFLIDKERNIDEGLDLAEKALESDPENYASMHCKGWGCFKLGKIEEALELLERSWELKPVYSHRLKLNLDEVRKESLKSKAEPQN